MGEYRKDVLSWDSYFMAMAMTTNLRSKDPSTQVGAVIVDKDHRILSLGYNGTPTGFDDKDFPWGKNSENPLDNKYLFVAHSERNAILNYRGAGKDMEGATLYVTLFPCNNCAIEVIQSGIKEVVYDRMPENETPEVWASKILLERCGVKTRKYEHVGKTITIEI